MTPSGKVLVVTGAGSGMGREVTLELLRRGARVTAVDMNEGSLGETMALAGSAADRLSTLTANIVDKAAVDALPPRVTERWGAVDGLIHCAGIIQPFQKVNDLDWASIERVFSVNWLGTVQLTKAFLPYLLQRPEAHLVNVSSMGGFLPVPGQTIYGASKAAVKLFTEGLHSELRGTKVRVTVVFPGAVATNITANSGVAIPSLGGPQPRTYPAARAAIDILNAMERNRFRVLVGPDAKFLDFLYRLSPARAAGFIADQMKALLSH